MHTCPCMQSGGLTAEAPWREGMTWCALRVHYEEETQSAQL